MDCLVAEKMQQSAGFNRGETVEASGSWSQMHVGYQNFHDVTIVEMDEREGTDGDTSRHDTLA